jgi:hypothetical protein
MALPLLRFVAYRDYYTVRIENLTELTVPQIRQLEAYAAERRSLLDFSTATMKIWKRVDYAHFNKTLKLAGIAADTIESEVVRPDSMPAAPAKDPVVGFGKHRGMRYGDLPEGYLLWLKNNYSGPERGLIEAELTRRGL